jgi:beta-glucanase (GH16 family)
MRVARPSCLVAGLLLACGSGSERSAGPGASGAPAPSSPALPEPEGSSSPEPTAPELGGDSELPLGETPEPEPPGEARTLALSDVCALPGETNGWGPIERDVSNGEQAEGDGGPLAIGDVLFGKGLGVHAPSDVTFALGGSCSRFTAQVGVDDEMKSAGSVTFELWGDGEKLAESATLTGSDPAAALDVDVSGVNELRLVVTNGGTGGSDHADWGDPRVTCTRALEACASTRAAPPTYDGYQLIWADEFDGEGSPDPAAWSFENGFVRNEEAQWYQADNATRRSGFLIIEGRRERLPNPSYRAGSGDWKQSRQFAEYTSSSLHTRGKQSFRFGRLELRARFPAYNGLWPAWWTLGNNGEWPSNGEVDILEFYQGALHANFVAGTTTRYEGNWDAVATQLSALGDADWDARFHVYRMDWDAQKISLYVDGRLLNDMNLSELRNPDGQSPFDDAHYMLLNLAIGGQAGGDPNTVPFPVRYEIDWVRAYEAL